jgi:4-nitrophenyl phosphatase
VRRFSHLLLDIEGTIVLDKQYTPVPGAVKWFNSLKGAHIEARLVTNNTTESPEDFYRILRQRGFRFAEKDFYTCLTEAVAKMKRRGVTRCLVLARKTVKDYLRRNGIKAVGPNGSEAVLVGHDQALTYSKLNNAVIAIADNGATLFTLHRNRRFVDERGEIALSAGPIAAALENACHVRAEVCGKPNKQFFLDSIKGWDVPPHRILMVSDDPFADLVGAKKLGLTTCWVLAGSQRDPESANLIQSKFRPDYILNNVVDIPI